MAQVKTSLPRLPEIEKIKILKVSIDREIEERDPNGLVSRHPMEPTVRNSPVKQPSTT